MLWTAAVFGTLSFELHILMFRCIIIMSKFVREGIFKVALHA